jgi:FADH2 O2-dependent halogenase
MNREAIMPSGDAKRDFDVIILGSGIGGTLLGSILARHGVGVLILEKDSHPRFAIGESTVPETTFLFEVLSKRYDVPELGNLKNYHRVRRHVSSACGVKRNFSFAYHRRGERHRPLETTQFPTWGPPFGPDVHLFRQDIDAYLLAVAVRYGATVRQRACVTALDLGHDGVRVDVSSGDRFSGRYLVDASGHASPVARALSLRQTPCPMKTRSRTIFTHMIGVAAYDRCGPSAREHGMPSPLSHGTLHHLFDGGWLWIIPFDNHPTSTNPLCSVGLSFDMDRCARPDLPPAEELWSVVSRFPDVARQLASARAVRAWVGTDRLQYSSVRAAGDRFFLLPHSAGFADALFSGGLTLTVTTINALSHRLIDAAKDGDFRPERFASVEQRMQEGIAHNDRLVACGYTAMREFELWNAWHRVWMLGATYGATGHVAIVARYDIDHDRRHFDRFEEPPHRRAQSADIPEFAALFDAAAREVEAVREGTRTAAEATRAIYELLGASGLCPPHWKLTDPTRRCPTTFTLLPLARLAAWGFLEGPGSLRKNFDLRGRISPVLSAVSRDVGAELRRSAGLVTGLLKDAWMS